jgi:TetR/AcrR family transcriptional repressor of nem operon
MRYDSEHKQKTREKVVTAAAKAIRAKGPEGVGVAQMMAEVGLTHGGFYAHFRSKDDLIGAAFGQMFDEAVARLRRHTEGATPRDGFRGYVDFYLSRAHRDARGSGCPVAALSSDLPRLSVKMRRHFTDGVEHLTDTFSELFTAMKIRNARATARSVFAELVGALLLARLESDEPKSDAILAASHDAILARVGLDATH